jgi:hypothetical protein
MMTWRLVATAKRKYKVAAVRAPQPTPKRRPAATARISRARSWREEARGVTARWLGIGRSTREGWGRWRDTWKGEMMR